MLFAFEETGEGVVGTLSGSLDLSTAVFEFDRASDNPAIIIPNLGCIVSSVASVEYDAYVTERNVPFGTGGFDVTGIPAGEFFSLDAPIDPFVGLPDGYKSNDLLSGTLTFTGATYASLGITPETYVLDLALAPNDWTFFADPETLDNSITLVFSDAPASIPLPAGLPLLLADLVGLAIPALSPES